jgi:hypothetical protein
MSEMNKIIEILYNEPVKDIVVPGFIDEDNGHKNFHLMLNSVYFEFDHKFLRFASIDQYFRLSMKVVEELTCDFDIDEDDEFCLSSLFELTLSDAYSSARVTFLRCFLDAESDIEAGVVKCAEFHFENRNIIFIDPTYTYGIRIGTQEQRDRWISDYASKEEDYQEYVWKRDYCDF